VHTGRFETEPRQWASASERLVISSATVFHAKSNSSTPESKKSCGVGTSAITYLTSLGRGMCYACAQNMPCNLRVWLHFSRSTVAEFESPLSARIF
jgi:hypothetical protein